MRVLYENCKPEEVNTKQLPYSAYLIEYEHEGTTKYDIAVAGKAVDIFDHYYDKYKKGFKNLKQSQGLVNPMLWNEQQAQAPKKEKKKKRKEPPAPPKEEKKEPPKD